MEAVGTKAKATVIYAQIKATYAIRHLWEALRHVAELSASHKDTFLNTSETHKPTNSDEAAEHETATSPHNLRH